ncbi:MAG: hypothetical protein K9L24_00785 [Spirochaetia bacterium]|nr:hypothetical protein [Spirochaetia bacterium]MCF7945376.1 hypothetical protein [Spirochaetia bacterium]
MIDAHLMTKDDYSELMKQVSCIKEELLLMRSIAMQPDIVKIKDIAYMENVSHSLLRGKCRYLLPRFGVSAYEDGPIRWPLEEYMEWRKIEPDKRKEMWADLPVKERQKIVMGKHYYE